MYVKVQTYYAHIQRRQRSNVVQQNLDPPASVGKKPNLIIDGKYIRQSILGFGKDLITSS